MNKNTKKAIKRRIKKGDTCFTVGRTTYYVNYERRTVIHYLKFVYGPKITYFDELGL